MCAGASNVGGYERNTWYNLSCLLKTYCHLSIIKKKKKKKGGGGGPLADICFETYGVIGHDSGWSKGVVASCLELEDKPLVAD